MNAIQDSIPHNHCYGCGPENPDGLQIKSYWDGKESVCTYMPRPEQCAGPTQYLYGGTIASIIDCHSVCTSIANYYARHRWQQGQPVGVPADIIKQGAERLATRGLKSNQSVKKLKQAGIRFDADPAAGAQAALREREGESGPEYRVVFDNFFVSGEHKKSTAKNVDG